MTVTLSLIGWLWGVPAIQAILELLCALFRRDVAVDDLRTHAPQFVLQIGLAAGENLVAVADGGFTLAAPVQEFLREGVVEGDVMVSQREEAREFIAVQFGEFLGRHPLQERFGRLRILGGRVHAQGDVSVIADVAGVTGILAWRQECAHLEVDHRLEYANLPGTGGIDSAQTEREEVL